MILIYTHNSADDNGGKYQKVNTSANAICKYVTGFSLLPALPASLAVATIRRYKNIIINHIITTFTSVIILRSDHKMIFVQKFNNRLLFSTFICSLVKITNIISMIRQQAPENDVKKITSQEGET